MLSRVGGMSKKPEEIAAMQELVRQAMREGALGFSTSQIDIHVGEDGVHTGALPGHLIHGA